MIKYSVIIPHYNTPDLLSRCLRSIPEREDVQVIVIDDNSPNNEKFDELIPELKRDNVEWKITTDGLGAGHARNVGLSMAKGKWLIFADSDDFFDENFSSELDEFVNDEHDVIYFNIKCCDCYDTTCLYDKVDKLWKYKETGNDIYLRVCYTEPWGKFIKRSIIVNNGICFQETKAHNDLLFSIKVGLLSNRVLVIDRPLYWYVIREGSLGHQKGEEPFNKICDRIRAWDSAQNYLIQHKLKTKFYLPLRPCLNAMKKNPLTYFKLLVFMKKNNYRYMKTIVDTLRFVFLRLFNTHVLRFQDALIVDSLKGSNCHNESRLTKN